MRKITITAGSVTASAVLNDSATADAILDKVTRFCEGTSGTRH